MPKLSATSYRDCTWFLVAVIKAREPIQVPPLRQYAKCAKRAVLNTEIAKARAIVRAEAVVRGTPLPPNRLANRQKTLE